jgi:hypothetical protein
MEHTPEPWIVAPDDPYEPVSEDWGGIFYAPNEPAENEPLMEMARANISRSVTCVNACKGLSAKALEKGIVTMSLATCEATANIEHYTYVDLGGITRCRFCDHPQRPTGMYDAHNKWCAIFLAKEALALAGKGETDG